MLADPAEAAARLGLLARVDEGDLPRLGVPLMDLHRVLRHVERDVRHVQEVVGEVFLDDVALEAAADDEVRDAVRRVDLHHVPEQWLAADFDHRLRTQHGLFAEPGT